MPSINCNATATVCEGSFTIKDKVWRSSAYHCNNPGTGQCNDPSPGGGYTFFSKSSTSALQKSYAGHVESYSFSFPHYNFTGYNNCQYQDVNQQYMACDAVGYYTYLDSNNTQQTQSFVQAKQIAASVAFNPINCPNNGTYVPGQGCATNSYTDSSGNFYQTDRTLTTSSSYCLPCELKEIVSSIATKELPTVAYTPPNSLANPKIGDPIDVVSRSVVEYETDISFPIPFSRTYSSKRTDYSNIGGGWRHNFDKRLTVVQGSDANGAFISGLTFNQDNDELVAFTRTSSTGVFTLSYLDQIGFTVTVQTNTITLKNPQGTIEIYDLNGNLLQLTTGKGMTYTIARNNLGQMTTISNSYGQWLSFTYSNYANAITQINGSNGDVYTYNYMGGMLTSVVLNNAPAITYGYSGTQLTSITDQLNNVISAFTYNANGEAIENARVANGTKIEQHNFAYNSSGATETQPNGKTANFPSSKYMYQSKLTGFTEGNRTYGLGYDSLGNITSYMNNKNGYYQYTYDSNNLVTSIRRPENGTAYLTWDTTSRLPLSITEPYSGGTRTITFNYDQYRNLISRTISGAGGSRTWSSSYALGGKVTSQTGPDGNSLSYSYYDANANINLRGLLHTVTNGLNQTMTVNGYDNRGNPTSITGFNGVTKTMVYDTFGRVLSETVGNATSTYVYNAAGDLLQANLATGYQLAMTYDAAHRLISISDNHGGIKTFTLDSTTSVATSEQTYQSNGLVATRNKIIDNLGRTTKLWHSNPGVATTYNYYGDDNISSMTDAKGISHSQSTDSMNRVTNVSDPAWQASYTLDGAGKIQETKLNYYQTTTTIYNAFDEITQMISPDTGTHSYSNNVGTRVSTHTDNAGTTHTMQSDVGGRPVSVTHSNNSTTLNEGMTYYPAGQLNTVSDTSGSTVYGYDGLGRVTQKTQNIGSKSFTVTYGYDGANQLTTTTYPSGLTVNYTYNAGLLSGISTSAGGSLVSNISYQSLNGLPVAWNIPGGQVNANYSVDGLMTGFSDNTMNQAITTDGIGNITAVNDPTNSVNISANYTNANQLTTGSINGIDIDYRYESNLNIFLKRDAGTGPQFSYGQFTNKLTQYITPTYQYFTVTNDGNGNVVTDNKGSYAYDLKNNMKLVNTTTGTGTYTFNALNQRVTKTVNGITTYFVYNENHQLIGEYDGNNNLVAEHVYFGLRPVGVYKNSQMYTVHTDYLGTPRIITDSGNSVVWKWLNLTANGNNLPSIQNITYNLRFSGQYFDNESLLHYNYYRTYNPETGRYMQSDPIGLAAGANTYNYIGGNPLSGVDPLGLYSGQDLLNDATNFVAGFGDSASYGGTKAIRDFWEIGSVNYDSNIYSFGGYTDVAIGLGSFGLSWKLNNSLIKANLSAKAKSSLRYQSAKTYNFKSLYQSGCEVHHNQPLFGHPGLKGLKGVKTTLFPTGQLPTWINSSKLNLRSLNRADHLNAHLKLINLEKFWGTYHSPVISGMRLEINQLYNQD